MVRGRGFELPSYSLNITFGDLPPRKPLKKKTGKSIIVKAMKAQNPEGRKAVRFKPAQEPRKAIDEIKDVDRFHTKLLGGMY